MVHSNLRRRSIYCRGGKTGGITVRFVALVLAFGCGADSQKPRISDNGASNESPFNLVLIDAKTENALGAFPYDRSLLAAAIKRSTDLGSRAVVLKFFLDIPRSVVGDQALAGEIRRTKVLLQAGSSEDDSYARRLPERFVLPSPALSANKAIHASTSGIPLALFSTGAFDVGFSDYVTPDRMPLVEEYGGKYVKSLYLACLEIAVGMRATVQPGKAITIGSRTLKLDRLSQRRIRYPQHDTLHYSSFVDFLNSDTPVDVKNKIVIIGFDGEEFAPIETPIGLQRPHRVFYYALLSLYHDVMEAGGNQTVQ